MRAGFAQLCTSHYKLQVSLLAICSRAPVYHRTTAKRVLPVQTNAPGSLGTSCSLGALGCDRKAASSAAASRFLAPSASRFLKLKLLNCTAAEAPLLAALPEGASLPPAPVLALPVLSWLPSGLTSAVFSACARHEDAHMLLSQLGMCAVGVCAQTVHQIKHRSEAVVASHLI